MSRTSPFITVSFWLFISSTYAYGMSCNGVNAEVFAPDLKLSESICTIAIQTATFMDKIGFSTSNPLHITITKKFKPRQLAAAYGFYNSHENKIQIIDLASHLSDRHSKKPFGLAMTKELHQSFIVHEISHAYTQANAPKDGLSLAAHEYIAYVTQFSLLPTIIRSAILANYNVPPFENENEMSALYFYLNPEYFAVKSWRHFDSQRHGESFIKAIIQGEKLKRNNPE